MLSSYEKFKDFTVLYVEDETSIRSSVEHCLKYIFNVVCAQDGQDGLEKFHSQKIDAIITDINMPVKDGLTMLESIRESYPDIPFIITSAYEMNHMSRIDKIGVYKYLSKPFDMKELVTNTMEALR